MLIGLAHSGSNVRKATKPPGGVAAPQLAKASNPRMGDYTLRRPSTDLMTRTSRKFSEGGKSPQSRAHHVACSRTPHAHEPTGTHLLAPALVGGKGTTTADTNTLQVERDVRSGEEVHNSSSDGGMSAVHVSQPRTSLRAVRWHPPPVSVAVQLSPSAFVRRGS